MKRSDSAIAEEGTGEDLKQGSKSNGRGHSRNGSSSTNLSIILNALQTMRAGDFSVRLPGAWVGVEGKVADTFNDIVASNQHMAHELKRVGQVVGKEGKTRERAQFHESKGAWARWKFRSTRWSKTFCGPQRKLLELSRPLLKGI
jgi:hypothetical protein